MDVADRIVREGYGSGRDQEMDEATVEEVLQRDLAIEATVHEKPPILAAWRTSRPTRTRNHPPGDGWGASSSLTMATGRATATTH